MVSKTQTNEKKGNEDCEPAYSSPFFLQESKAATAILAQIKEQSENSADRQEIIASLSDKLKIKRRLFVNAITQDKIDELPVDKVIKSVGVLTEIINTLEQSDKGKPTEKDEINSKINDKERKRIKEEVNRVLS